MTGLLQQRSDVASYITMYACVACPVGMKLARQVCEVVLCIAPSYSGPQSLPTAMTCVDWLTS